MVAASRHHPRRRRVGRGARDDTRAILHERKAAGLARRDGVHVPQSRSFDRSRRARWPTPGRSSSPPARTSPTPTPSHPAGGGRTPASAATPGSTTTPRSGAGLRAAADEIEAAGHRARRVRRRQLDRRSGGRPPRRSRLVRQERQPAAARRRQLLRARLDHHHGRVHAERACRRPTAAAAVSRCIDGCPTAAIVAPGVIDGERCLSWVLQKPGLDPGRVPRGDPRPHLRLRRLPGRLPDLGPARASQHGRLDAASTRSRSHVDVLELLDLDDATIEERYGRW